jgi:hypothetical protein
VLLPLSERVPGPTLVTPPSPLTTPEIWTVPVPAAVRVWLLFWIAPPRESVVPAYVAVRVRGALSVSGVLRVVEPVGCVVVTPPWSVIRLPPTV